MLGGINNQMFFEAFGGFFALLILIPLLRWTFSRGRSHVARPAKSGNSDEYGLLVPVSKPANFIEGEMARKKLIDANIKANLVQAKDGIALLVFPEELSAARAILNQQ
ncbi:MAG: hypothetical protein EBR76_05535 [Actinobacteria bacterium]|nr:hypothetical protein [Actinomycetota bacterium]